MLLVVDDDPRFLNRAQDALGRSEFVLFASNAEQTRSLIASVGEEITAVLIDLDLRGEDGFSLIGELHAAFPTLPLIAISGVAQPHVLESARLLGAAAALPKPITSDWSATIERARARATG
jgi:DNA-binding NtrC family response regulator